MAPDLGYFCREFWSGVPAGTQKILFGLSRRLRFAPAPANIHRPSGAPNSFAEFANSIQRAEGAWKGHCMIRSYFLTRSGRGESTRESTQAPLRKNALGRKD